MSSDFGQRRRSVPRRSLQVWLVIALTVAVALGIVGVVLIVRP